MNNDNKKNIDYLTIIESLDNSIFKCEKYAWILKAFNDYEINNEILRITVGTIFIDLMNIFSSLYAIKKYKNKQTLSFKNVIEIILEKNETNFKKIDEINKLIDKYSKKINSNRNFFAHIYFPEYYEKSLKRINDPINSINYEDIEEIINIFKKNFWKYN